MLRIVAILRALAFLSRFLYYGDVLLLLLVVLLGSILTMGDALRLNARVGRYNLMLLLRWPRLTHLWCVVAVRILRHLAHALHHFILEAIVQVGRLASVARFDFLASTERLSMARGRLTLTRISPSMAATNTAWLSVLRVDSLRGRCCTLANRCLVEQFLLLYKLVLTRDGLLGFFQFWSEAVNFRVFGLSYGFEFSLQIFF